MFLDVDGRAESKKFGQCVRSLSVEVCKVPAVVEQLTSLCSDVIVGYELCR